MPIILFTVWLALSSVKLYTAFLQWISNATCAEADDRQNLSKSMSKPDNKVDGKERK